MKSKEILLSIFFVTVLLTACEKFQVLTSEDRKSVEAGSNIKNLTIWEYLSMDDFHKNDSSKVGLYGKAIEHAGLKDLLNNTGDFTIIIPSNDAIKAMIKTLGYTNLEDVPPVVLKNFLSSTIIEGRVRSFDLEPGETRLYPCINNDTLSLNRNSTITDPYRLVINNASKLASATPTVRSQNLEFKNGVAHVVPNYTNYIPKIRSKDVADAVVKTDIIPVTKDSYVNGGTSTLRNTNYGSAILMRVKNFPTDMSFTRRGITQFPVVKPSFTERIGSVEIALFINRIDGAGSISINEDENVDWAENTINWNNCPAPGAVPLSSFSVATTENFSWKFGAITSAYLNALAANKTFINIGISTPNTPLYEFASKEAAANRRPYLIVKSVAATVLTNPTNTGLVVNKETGFKTITSSELNFQGAADYNIFYNLKSKPSRGILVLNGIPMSEGSFFTQEQLKKGAVKYLYNGTESTDSFVLEASDFQNGFYDTLQTVNVQIQ